MGARRTHAALTAQTQPEAYEPAADRPAKRAGRHVLCGAVKRGHARRAQLLSDIGVQLENRGLLSFKYL